MLVAILTMTFPTHSLRTILCLYFPTIVETIIHDLKFLFSGKRLLYDKVIDDLVYVFHNRHISSSKTIQAFMPNVTEQNKCYSNNV